jgi:hypothetical protein
MNHGCSVDFRDSQQDALAEFIPGSHPDMPKKGARHFAKEGLHNIEPRSVLWCQHVLETIGSGSQVGLSLFGNMRRMVVQNASKGAVGRIVLIEVFEQRDEFSAAMSPLNAGCDLALVQIQRRASALGRSEPVAMS